MYYKSIKRLKAKHWIEVQDGNLKALRWFVLFGSDRLDNKAHESILNDYIRLFDFSDSFNVLWDKRIKLAKLQMEYLTDFVNNRWMLTDIEVLEGEIIKLIETQGEPMSMVDLIAELKGRGENISVEDTVYLVEKMARRKQS
tara:strand:- start:474 stop:899 length:426 start_codon:yes stop_codon:yes gene_type:complete